MKTSIDIELITVIEQSQNYKLTYCLDEETTVKQTIRKSDLMQYIVDAGLNVWEDHNRDFHADDVETYLEDFHKAVIVAYLMEVGGLV